jgi:methyl-accepting chemotaxis protein
MTLKFVENIKIRTKIYGGFLSILVLLTAVGVIGGYGVSSGGHDLLSYAEVSDNAVRATQIDRLVVGLRRNVFTYNVNADPIALKRIGEIKNDLSRLLSVAIEGDRDPEQKKSLLHMQDVLLKYFNVLDQAKSLRERRAQLFSNVLVATGAKTHEIVNDLIKKTTAANDLEGAVLAGQVLEDLMSARLAATQFQMTGDEGVLAVARGAIHNLDKVSSDALMAHVTDPMLEAEAKEIDSLSGKYAEAFEETAAAIKEGNNLVNVVMEGMSTEFAKLVSDVAAMQRNDMARLEQKSQASVRKTLSLVIVFSVAAVILGLLLAWLTARGIIRPLGLMTGTMRKLAGGDHTITVPGLNRRDEIGDMAQAVEVFKENAEKIEQMAKDQELAKAKAEQDRRAAILHLADDFDLHIKGVVQNVSAQATELQATAESLSAVSEQASRQSAAVASAAEEASSNVQTVASAADELSASINEISRQVSQSASMAHEAVDEAKRTNDIVASLAEAADKIGAVVNLIADIASQTNLLALNATIEAARAGEAGKGFAVVAGEVKSLANQTARATDEISQQIGAIQAATRNAVNAIEHITRMIGDISQVSTGIASAVEEQGAATREIARNVQQAAAGTQQVTLNISGVLQAAGETGHGASDVLDAVRNLSQQSEALTTQVDSFIGNIRSN